MKPLRIAALEIAEREATKGVKEVGGNNRGPRVAQYLREVGLPQGYPWCAAFVSWCFHKAALERLPWESAGVASILAYGEKHGWIVARPFRGDLVCFNFGEGNGCTDHVGFVKKVLSLRPVGFWLLRTTEGNTSSGKTGSQQDGGGVYVRTRLVRRSSVRFVRVPNVA